MPRKDFTLPSSLPWTVPERVLTCGAEDDATSARGARIKSESRKQLRTVDEDMTISAVTMRTPDCKGKASWDEAERQAGTANEQLSQISMLPSTIINHEWSPAAEALYPSASQGGAAFASGGRRRAGNAVRAAQAARRTNNAGRDGCTLSLHGFPQLSGGVQGSQRAPLRTRRL